MSSHRQIFKSAALVGGTQVINMGIGIFRTKALAVLLGPGGMGLAGLYTSTTALIGSVAGLGINASGVRQIAKAAGTNDQTLIARTIVTLRRVSLFSGFLGMMVALALAPPLSRLTFGDDKHVTAIAFMSLTLLCADISAGQIALLQGLRRLRDMAASQVLGSLFGAIASVALVWWLREQGIVPYLIAVSAFGILLSWWFARRVPVQRVRVTWRETFVEARGLVLIGAAFVTAGLISSGAAYLTRVLLQHELGLVAVGIYTATWTLCSYYVSFVLGAMGTDFLPRLTASADDHPVVNRLVNEQTEMGVLIAVPGVLATMTLAPWVMRFFYSSAFMQGADLARWQVLGVFLRVVSWPLGYVLIAKGKGLLYALTELASGIVSVVLVLLGVKLWGLEGAGIAFFALYVAYTAMMLLICWRMTSFRWSDTALKILAPTIVALATVFACTRYLPEAWSVCLGLVIASAAGAASLLALQKLLDVNFLDRIRAKLGWAEKTN